MPDVTKTLDQFLISPGEKVKLKDHDPTWEGDRKIPKEKRKEFAQELLKGDVEELAEAQELLYAADTWSVLLIFQAMDAAGKDSTIKHVMRGINPQGCQVYSFKHPSHEELDHNFLWRCMKVLPERGRIGIFNRSYYEEVLIVKVHPDLVAAQRIPNGKINKDFWQARYDDINAFERHLARNGTLILKFFLNVSKKEQKQRFLDRLNEPEKLWKFNPGDVKERGLWDEYMEAYEEMLRETSTEWAPWYVVPADHKWVTRAVVARIVSLKIKSLKLAYPEVTKEQKAAIAAARRELERE
ncbi:MAG TPA: polyphosphate kinase 2 family protein [Pirellulaceae bacterium]|nr:polyphosphate kinase 2 family protein [Pirellulaceae bacterium]